MKDLPKADHGVFEMVTPPARTAQLFADLMATRNLNRPAQPPVIIPKAEFSTWREGRK